MNTRTALNLALLILVLGLAGLALWPPDAPRSADPVTVVPLEREQIERIRLERTGAPAIALFHEAGRWQMRQPFATEADPARVDTVLRLLELTSLARYPLAELELAEYGLAVPALAVGLNDLRIEFGDVAALDRQRYVRVGERLHLVPGTLFYHLQAPAEAYVSRRLLPESSELEAVQLPGLRLLLEAGAWRTEPLQVSAAAAADWAARWRRTRAVRVRAYRNEALGEPVELVLQDAAGTLRWVPLRDGTGLLRPDLGLVYELSAGALAGLLHPTHPRTPGPAGGAPDDA